MRPIGFFGVLAIAATIASIAWLYGVYTGSLVVMPAWWTLGLGLVLLGIALWRGSTRWLLLLLPVLLTPFIFFLLLFTCDKCIA